jgi:hypothetical protein
VSRDKGIELNKLAILMFTVRIPEHLFRHVMIEWNTEDVDYRGR